MVRAAAFAFAAILLAAPVAHAASVPLGNATVEFDPAVWKVTELSGVAALQFACIAPDCPGEPSVYATATSAAAAADDDPALPERDARKLADPLTSSDGSIAFVATSAWSGCRARDAATLAAVGAAAGTRYSFTTALGRGCNFLPAMPEGRFLELLRAVKVHPSQ
jgi:hypothetical protein